MPEQDRWKLLLCRERHVPRGAGAGAASQNHHHRAFEEDYQRIVFSSAFRRLQDKTQVFPLEPNDYVRTRLTHSVEASCVGRTIGAEVAHRLSAAGKACSTDASAVFPALVSAACLAHDIGNPPFGHFGETAIRTWFAQHKHVLADLRTSEERDDFLDFEGNAQAFRILTRLQNWTDGDGLGLTYALLGTSLKYLRPSHWTSQVSQKSRQKCGYFQSERETFEQVMEKTGMRQHRHPLTFLVEAADDIAYLTGDVEDALKKGVLSTERLREELVHRLKTEEEQIVSVLSRSAGAGASGRDEDALVARRFRIAAQDRLVDAASQAFVEHYDSIMDGSFDEEILRSSSASRLYGALNDIGPSLIYVHPSVLGLELIGYEVIHGLLDRFVEALTSPDRTRSRTRAGKIVQLLSSNFRRVAEASPGKLESRYNQLHVATDYLCGMTDSFALNLFQRITGSKVADAG